MRCDHGFTFLELLIAMGIMAGVMAGLFGLISSAQSAVVMQPEASDVQQRLRVAADTLGKDLAMAGAGASFASSAGPLDYYFAPVLPFRAGAVSPDPPGAFRADVITLLYAGPSGAQTTTAADTASTADAVAIHIDPGCPAAGQSCGFAAGDTALLYDGFGQVEPVSVRSVSGSSLAIAANRPAGAPGSVFKSGSKIVGATERTYGLKTDAARGVYQLVVYNGGTAGDMPIVDHVVGLRFEYYGDPQPPRTIGGESCVPAPSAPCTTYGPAPPVAGRPAPTAYPPGENCVFTRDPVTGAAMPRLAVLGADPLRTASILLSAAELTDGPWCPDDAVPGRFDADLLRVRRISITLRVEAANDTLRGPAGFLFTRGGTAADVRRFLPDQEIRFDVSPRNLNASR